MAVSGRVVMAWVWLALVTLARLSTAEKPHQDSEESSATPEAPFSNSVLPEEMLSGGEFIPVQLWKFVKDGADHSGLGRPLFSCSESSMSIRLRLIRHTDLRLSDGRGFGSLPADCGAAVRTTRSWLLLELPYTSCPMEAWIVNKSSVHQMKLRYFDHLLQANMTAVATCQSPAAEHQPAQLLVRCRSEDVTIKLPLGTDLERLKAVDRGRALGTALSLSASPDGMFVHISTLANTDSFLEMMILGSAGEVFTALVACVESTGRKRGRRSVRGLFLANWDDDDVIPDEYGSEFTSEEYYYEDIATTVPSCVGPTTARPSCKVPTTTAAPSCMTTAPPCEVITTTAAPSCTTTAPPCEVIITTAAPSCTTTAPPCEVITTTTTPSCMTTAPPCEVITTTTAPPCEVITTTAAPSCTTTAPPCAVITTTAPSCTTTAPSCTTSAPSCTSPTKAPSCMSSTTTVPSCPSKTTASFCVNPRAIAGGDVTPEQPYTRQTTPGSSSMNTTPSSMDSIANTEDFSVTPTTDLATTEPLVTTELPTTVGVATTSTEEGTTEVGLDHEDAGSGLMPGN